MGKKMSNSASSPFTTRQLQGKPTLIGEAVNGFLTGKSIVLSTLFYWGGKVLMETCGRELTLAKERIMEEEHLRVHKLEREIERRRRKFSPSDTRTDRSPPTVS